MKTPCLAFVVLLSVVGQSVLVAQPGLEKKAADAAWDKTVALAAPAPATAARSAPGAGPTAAAAQVIAAVRDEAQRQKNAAQSAKDFQQLHPTDARVPQAKKIEAVSALRSVWPLPPDRGQAAFQTAAAFAADAAHSPADRFEVVALLAEQRHRVLHGGRSLARDSAAHEAAAEALHAQFGDVPECFAFYLGVADTAEVETSRRAASKIALARAAPEALKQQARSVLARYEQLGKPVTLNLTEQGNGRRVNGTLRGKVTVVYVWSASHGAAAEWGELAAVKRSCRPGSIGSTWRSIPRRPT